MIKQKLKERNIDIGINFLRRILPDIGFKFKSVSENRKVLIERNEIRASRANYLRTVQDFRTRGYQIVYLDEAWIKPLFKQILASYL